MRLSEKSPPPPLRVLVRPCLYVVFIFMNFYREREKQISDIVCENSCLQRELDTMKGLVEDYKEKAQYSVQIIPRGWCVIL